jgi:hypothetical protein
MVLDTSVKTQICVEDWEVCCHPIEIRYTVADDGVREFEARAIIAHTSYTFTAQRQPQEQRQR